METWDKIQKNINTQYAIITTRNRNNNNIEHFYELSSNGAWDTQLLDPNSKLPKPNAYIFGLVINDWDNSLRSRNTRLKTEDLEIPFQAIESIPEWSKDADYADMGDEILGRFESFAVYKSSRAQEISLILHYSAYTYDNNNALSYWTLENIEIIDKRLKALVYPMYTRGFAPPPKLLLNIGNIYRDFPVIVKSVKIEYLPPYDYFTGLAINRKVSLTLRSAYPAWQVISGDKVYLAKSSRGGGNKIFAYKKLTVDFTRPSTQNTPWYRGI